MRILFLAHRIPVPPNKGDKIRSNNFVRHLAGRHEVYLGCLIDDPGDLTYAAEAASIVNGFCAERIGYVKRLWSAFTGLFLSQSVSVRYFHSSRLQLWVDRLLDTYNFDVVFCSSSPMAEYVFRSRHCGGQLARIPLIMDLIDVDSTKWAQYAQRASAWSSWVYRHEARYLALYEQRIAARFQCVLLVSEDEKAHFPGGESHPKLVTIGNGVDLEKFLPGYGGKRLSASHSLVFTGVMDYWPNVEGVTWFAREVLPRVRAKVPEVQFFIVGTRPGRAVRRLAELEGVVVTGFVDDIRDYIGGADLSVVPLRIARGVQNKILEAMAMGRAVVSSPEAFEGIDAVAGRDVVVADGAEAFAASIVELLQQPRRAAEIGRCARVRVETSYSWPGKLKQLDNLLDASRKGRIDIDGSGESSKDDIERRGSLLANLSRD